MVSFHSLNASAVDLSEEVYYINGGQGALYFVLHTGGAWGSWNNTTYSLGANETIDMVRVRRQDNTNISDLQVGDYITFGMLYSLGGTNSKWNTTGTYYLGNSTVDNGVSCPIVDIDDTVVSNHADSSNTSQRHNAFITCRVATTSTQPTLNLQIRSINNTNGTAVFSFRTFTHWRPETKKDYSTDLETIKNKLTDLNAKSTITNNKLDDVNDNLSDIKNAQDQANQDAQDRYDQEKQEEQEREEQGASDNSAVLGLFNFSVLNPFSPIFNMFSSSCSVSIPTLANWLNSPSSTYTSWWCSNSKLQGIRSTLTPVFSIASIILLFGFVINWLRNDTSSVTVTYDERRDG